MTAFAPRLPTRLVALVEMLADSGAPVAEIWRQAGAAAEELGAVRPSYEGVRRIVRDRQRQPRYPGLGEVALDVVFRVRPPDAIAKQLAGTLPPKHSL